MSWGYRALVVGIGAGETEQAGDDAGLRQQLPFADEYAETVRELLVGGFGYEPMHVEDDPASSAAALDDAVRSALRTPGFLVVHIVGHGVPGRRSPELYVIGGDGARTDATVEHWITRIEDGPDETTPTVLFLLDLCHSGSAAQINWQQSLPDGGRRAWVVAACAPGEPAYDGRFSKAVADVLTGFREGRLAMEPTWLHIPFGRFCKEVDKAVRAAVGEGGYPQRVTRPLVPLGDEPDLAFFRNPRFAPEPWRPWWLHLESSAAALLDEAMDPRHFISRGGGGDSSGSVETVYGLFSGRHEQARSLAKWIDGEGGSLRIVTGKPGVGKSALLGVLVCAAHRQLMSQTHPLWSGLGNDAPSVVPDLAVIHARRRSLPGVLASLAKQWRLGDPKTDTTWSVPALVAALTARGGTRTLVLDALDEADRPDEIASALLIPLSRAVGPDDAPVCRVLVGCRPDPRYTTLFTAAGDSGVLNLDTVVRIQVQRDVASYVSSLMRADLDYNIACPAQLRAAMASRMATALVSGPGDDADPAPQPWGEFLVAALYTRHLIRREPAPTNDTEAAALADRIPRTLRGILDLELSHREQPWLGPVLTALAYARGAGMPPDIAAALAPQFAAPEHSAPDWTEVRDALHEARFYVRRDVEQDGTPLYRLFHQGLADELQAPEAAGEVWRRLLGTVTPDDDGVRDWAGAESYMLRHAAQHALDAGCFPELLDDAGFLAHAHPDALADAIRAYDGPHRPVAAAMYLANYGTHHDATPAERRQILAVDAARFDLPDLAGRLAAGEDWQVRWAAGRPVSRSLHATLSGHSTRIWGLSAFRMNGRPHLVSTAEEPDVQVWDLDALAATHTLRHPAGVGGSAVFRDRDTTFVVTGADDGVLRVWELPGGQFVCDVQAHTAPVFCLAASDDGVLVASGDGEGNVSVWDAAARGPVIRRNFGTETVDTVDVSSIDGDAHILVRTNGTVWLWEPHGRGEPLRLSVHASSVCAFTDDHIPHAVIGDTHGVFRVHDLRDPENVVRTVDAHESAITAIAVLHAGSDGVPHIVTAAQDGSVRVWHKLSDRRPVTEHTGHTTALCALATSYDDANPLIVTGGELGTVRLWKAHTAKAHRGLPGHHDLVKQLVPSGPTAVSRDESGGVRHWDLSTGSSVDAAGQVRDPDETTPGVGPYRITEVDSGALEIRSPDGGFLGRLDGHAPDRMVKSIVLCRRDGRPHLLTGGTDRTMRLWDLDTTKQVSRYTFPDSVLALAVTEQGEVLVGMGSDVLLMTPKPDTPRLTPHRPEPAQGTP